MTPSPTTRHAGTDDAPRRPVRRGSETVSRAREERSRRTSELFARAIDCDDDERETLLEEVILINVEVAESVASRYHRRGVADEELDAVARLALVKAARRFDPTLGHDFLSFAVPTVRGEVRRFFRDLGWFVRPPRRVQELQHRIAQVESSLGTAAGHQPDRQEVAEEVGCTAAEVEEAYAARGCFDATSLDSTPSDSDATPLVDRLGRADPGIAVVEARELLRPAIGTLKERDRTILRLRFVDQLHQHEIAERLGVTQVQVSRLLTRIMRDLRLALEDSPETETETETDPETGCVPDGDHRGAGRL